MYRKQMRRCTENRGEDVKKTDRVCKETDERMYRRQMRGCTENR